MAYTTINKGSSYFNTVTYTGTGVSRNQTGVGFNPDWVWIKSRSNAYSNNVWDRVRGAGQRLITNESGAEETQTGDMSAFVTDGITVGAGNITNANGATFVMWNWLANNTSGSSNTAGSITSTVSANTTAGFSIVSYTNPASGSPFTVGHGLGVAPKMIIVKTRNVAQTWGVWHTSIGFGNYLRLDSTAATAAANLVTATSSTTFSTYQNHHATSDTLIAYCFAEVKGYSKFGSYTGNGSADGTFVYTGFKPAFLIIKESSAAGAQWYMYDNKTAPFNLVNENLFPNLSNATNSGNNQVDFYSNGFKMRSSNTDTNNSGNTYIYMAFAENPFVTSTSIPTTAR